MASHSLGSLAYPRTLIVTKSPFSEKLANLDQEVLNLARRSPKVTMTSATYCRRWMGGLGRGFQFDDKVSDFVKNSVLVF
jgi:hypothetical protein